jgi:hypothetical protein
MLCGAGRTVSLSLICLSPNHAISSAKIHRMIVFAATVLCVCHPATWVNWKNDIEGCRLNGVHGGVTSHPEKKNTDLEKGNSSAGDMRQGGFEAS